MIDYTAVMKTWESLVNIAQEGKGPWRAWHDRGMGWCVKQPGRSSLIVQTKREATAVAAALNAVVLMETERPRG